MRIIPTCAREELGAAQFVLGEFYADWVWKERARMSIAPPSSSKAWPFRKADNVVAINSRKKQK